MYSITVEERKQKAKEVARVTGKDEAMKVVAHLKMGWRKSKKGRGAVDDGLETRLYFSDGKLASLIMVDPLFPAEGFPKRQPKVAKEGGAA